MPAPQQTTTTTAIHETAVGLATRDDVRNVAIVAHVDHGKTTLVDTMLRQSGAFGSHQASSTGSWTPTTWSGKRASPSWPRTPPSGTAASRSTSSTPQATPTSEARSSAASRWSTGCSSSSTPARVRCPRPGSCCARLSGPTCRSILVINKVDRADARIAEVLDEVYELFLDLGADRAADRVPDRLRRRPGRPGLAEPAGRYRCRTAGTSSRCSTRSCIIPAPSYDPDHPFQALVTNLDASPYVGRLALCRIRNGTIRRGQQVAWCRTDGTIERVKITELLRGRGARAGAAETPGPARSSPIAGIPEITIGETLADPVDPRPLPLITSTSRASR